jgi:hypothetical protein
MLTDSGRGASRPRCCWFPPIEATSNKLEMALETCSNPPSMANLMPVATSRPYVSTSMPMSSYLEQGTYTSTMLPQFHEASNPTTGLHDNTAATNHLAAYCSYGDISSLCREKALDGEDT